MSGDERSLYESFALAAYAGNLTTVLEMLSHGSVPVDFYGSNTRGRRSALYTACMGGRLSVVQALIRAGADINFSTWPHETRPLHAACNYCRSIEVVEALLNAGADVNAKNKYDETALLIALDPQDIYKQQQNKLAIV